MEQVRRIWKKRKLPVIAGVLAGVVAGGLLCALLHEQPEGYVIPRFYTDGLEETSYYLESEDDPAYEGYVVMNYVDGDTPMQLVTGKAVTLETVRYYTGSVLLGGFAGAVLLTGAVAWQQKHDNRKAEG